MFLGKYEMDRNNPATRKVLADRQALHRTVLKMFGTDRKTSDVLFRLNGDSIYISANIAPKAEVAALSLVASREIESIEGVHGFSLITTPHKKNNGKRITLSTERERLEWLKRKAEESGFRILSSREMGKEVIVSREKGFNVTAYRYDGQLLVTDKEKFEQARLKGIGDQKAYGCGMLIVA